MKDGTRLLDKCPVIGLAKQVRGVLRFHMRARKARAPVLSFGQAWRSVPQDAACPLERFVTRKRDALQPGRCRLPRDPLCSLLSSCDEPRRHLPS